MVLRNLHLHPVTGRHERALTVQEGRARAPIAGQLPDRGSMCRVTRKMHAALKTVCRPKSIDELQAQDVAEGLIQVAEKIVGAYPDCVLAGPCRDCSRPGSVASARQMDLWHCLPGGHWSTCNGEQASFLAEVNLACFPVMDPIHDLPKSGVLL